MDTATHVNTPALVTVPFHGDRLVTFQANGEPHVAMRHIVENIGIDWTRQLRKLEADGRFDCCHMSTVGADGRSREMLAMPVRKLPLWLATINPNKVRADLRPKLELYQAESAVALHDYWTKGVAVRGDLDGVVTNFDPKVRSMIGGIVKGVVHNELAAILPALIREAVGSSQFGVVKGLTAGDVLTEAGVTQRKGLRGLPRRVSDRLRRFHAENSVAVEIGSLGTSTAYMFDPALARRWLAEGGKATIEKWIAERRGQGVLKLVPRAVQPPQEAGA